MEEQKYLIAIALAEQNNKRIMPLGGKTIAGVDSISDLPKTDAEKILLDLMLRLFKRSTDANIKVSNYETGLLLAVISFEKMQENLPIIKSTWINDGDTYSFIDKLKSISNYLWGVQYEKHKGIIFNELT
tara:strand:+ start:612 stop:1001 length:390 start_codon:yes stop_codon:yes gene_type:complete